MVTFALVPMFGLLGMVTDLGYMHFVKMSAQTAAEAAARAAIIDFHSSFGGATYSCGTSIICADTPTACTASITTPNNYIDRGCMYAQAHGFNTGGNQTVTYTSGKSSAPPTASGFGNAAYWVTYRVVQYVPQLFSAVTGNFTGTVAARSTGAIIGASDCIYALDPTAHQALSVKGTGNLTSSCGLYVNSSASDALYDNGTTTLSAPEYDVVGNYSTHTPPSPTPNTGVSPITDPLSYLAAPATGPYHCDYTNYSAPHDSNPTLSPGVYCGGIAVGKNHYTLSTGTYTLVGGGLSTQNSNSSLSGDGVLIYNTFGLGDGHSYSYSGISLDANSTVSLKASNSGPYAGILIFEDRNAPATSDTYGGGSSAVYQGVIYAKNAAVTMYGNSGVSALYTILVADTISMVGTTGFNDDYSLLPNGSPIQQVVMVE